MNNSEFVKERDTALLSLDKDKIIKYMKKYEISMPSDDTMFWVGVHKAIININSATKEQKDKSFTWLVEYGFNPMTKTW